MNGLYDVVVVGAGNAALCAALAARDEGASVLVLERAPYEERGGNTAYTAGAMRVAYSGVEDVRLLCPDISPAELERTDFGAYSESDFFDDMARVTESHADPDLVEVLVRRSFSTLRWMQNKGVRFMPIYGRQAFMIDGRFKFWGGLTIEVSGGGQGLVESLTKACRTAGIEFKYGARAARLLLDGNERIAGLTVVQDHRRADIAANAVVLASGGFQANAEWRARYLGPGWDLAKVRGSKYNNGDGIRMALEVGAKPFGHWSGAHAVGWDLNAPETGDLSVGDGFQKHSYPFGIMVNSKGERFVDEGADFRNYTYAKYGRVILEQPAQFAWQVFDKKVEHLLRDEYRIRKITKVTAQTLEELATKLEGVDPEGFLRTVADFNRAVRTDVPFNPNVKDGRRAECESVVKSNWANTLDTPPYEAYAVTCGVTFTFGGLRISPDAEVMDTDGLPIHGLFACGELVGGIFYFNYPGGTGLTSGSVFGRLAGAGAARLSSLSPG